MISRLAFVFVLLIAKDEGQVPESQPLEFEVASVRPAAPAGRSMGARGGPGTSDPNRISYVNATLMGLLCDAYNVRGVQVAGPGWLNDLGFNIVATISTGSTRAQTRMMLQSLLRERFHIVVHREQRVFAAYALVVTKGGPRLLKSTPSTDPNAGPDIRRGYMDFVDNRIRRTVHKETMERLSHFLEGELRVPVLNKTELAGEYDFAIEYLPRQVDAPESDSSPTLFDAVQQLGLKLIKDRTELEVIVVDHADKVPTDN